jgi:nitroreductase
MAMNIDELLDLMRKRRSYRKFKPDPVPDEYINKILEAGRWAQSGSNAQPWEYIVIKSQETKNKLAERWVPTRLHTFNIEKIRRPDMIHHALHKPQGTPPGSWKDAPVLIVVCGDRRTMMASVLYMNFITTEGGPSSVFIKNMANTVHNMHLAVAALGLGSQWLSVDYVFEQDVKAILGIPPILEVHSLVAIGYPEYQLGTGYRRDLNEIVHLEKYDFSKHRSDDEVIDFIMRLMNLKM